MNNKFKWVRIIQICFIVFNYAMINLFFPEMWFGFILILAFVGSVIETFALVTMIAFIIGFFNTVAASGENIPDDTKVIPKDIPVLTPGRVLNIVGSSPETGKLGDMVFAQWIEIEELGKYNFDGLVSKTSTGSYDLRLVPAEGLVIEPGLLYLPQK